MVRSRSDIGLLLAAAVTAAAAVPAYAEDQVLLRAREGAAAMIRGQFDKAVTLYDEALGTPDVSKFVLASIYSDRGVAKWRLKQTKEAIDDFNQSIELSPEVATVYNNRGNALMDLGHPDEALKDFDRAIALSAEYGAAFVNRGNAYAALEQYDQSFQSFRKAAELMPQSAVPFNGRGQTHAELGRYHAAVRDFNRAIELNDKYAAAYRNRAKANFALSRYSAAADDVTKSLELEPGVQEVDLLLLRAKAYSGEGKFREALADFNKVLELNPDLIEAYVQRGILFANNRRFDDAIGDYTRVIQVEPRNTEAFTRRAEAKLNAKDLDGALADINEAFKLGANDALTLRVRGNIYEQQGREYYAIVDYRNALAKDPQQAESHEALARLKQEIPVSLLPLGPAVDGWVITEPTPGNYVASNPDYGSIQVELEMFGAGKPKLLSWELKRGALNGIGLLTYYAGSFSSGEQLEYVAIVDTRANKVVSIEPQSWGDKTAQWNWQAVSVVVTDPEGHANELTLRNVPQRRTPVARSRRDTWGERAERRRGGGGGGGSPFGWLFR